MFNPKAAENSKRFTEASEQTDKVVAKYGKRFTTVSGHSQGGGISYLIGQEKYIRGYHFNPAISPKQVAENSKGLYAKNIEKQVLYKTHMDFASTLSYTKPIRKNFNVNLIGTPPGIDNSIVKTHSLDNFAARGGLNVERNTMVSSMKKGLGTGLSVGAQSYFLSQDIKGDLKNEKLDSYKGGPVKQYRLPPVALGSSWFVGTARTFTFLANVANWRQARTWHRDRGLTVLKRAAQRLGQYSAGSATHDMSRAAIQVSVQRRRRASV
jgi:hypothetical protein